MVRCGGAGRGGPRCVPVRTASLRLVRPPHGGPAGLVRLEDEDDQQDDDDQERSESDVHEGPLPGLRDNDALPNRRAILGRRPGA